MIKTMIQQMTEEVSCRIMLSRLINAIMLSIIVDNLFILSTIVNKYFDE